MGVGKSKEPPVIEILATGTVGAEPLRRLLECAGMGRVTVTDPSTSGWTANHSDGSESGVVERRARPIDAQSLERLESWRSSWSP